jgi:hypothetical protein
MSKIKEKEKVSEGNVSITLNKSYQFGTGKDAVTLPADKEIQVTPEQLANIDKNDIVRDELKN